MRARPIDDLAVRLDQRVELLLERSDLVGELAFQLLGLSRPDRGKVFANAAERRKPEADLEIGRGQEAEPERGERGNEQAGELGKIAVDLRAVSRDRIGIGRGVRARRPDLALEHAQVLAFGTRRIGATGEGVVGGDFALARQLELLVEERVGDVERTVRPVEGFDLPVPAGEGNGEDRFAERGRLLRLARAAHRARGDEARHIDVEARVETALDGGAVERREQDGGDRKDDQRPYRSRGEQPECEGVKPHRRRPRGDSRARGQS